MSMEKQSERFSSKPRVLPLRPKPESNGHTNGKKQKQEEALFYYEAPKARFWAKNSEGQWTEYPSTHVRLKLLQSGIDINAKDGELLSDFDLQMITIREANDVRWAGELAGFQPGVYTICGKKVLVTSGPKLIQPQKGDWPTLRTFMAELLGKNVDVLLGWLKCALRSMRSGPPFRPGQALAIAGPAGCGKSLLQGLITEVLGGRTAKPYRYLSGLTQFNGEMLGAEHLPVEDEAASTDLRIRRHFGSQLKNLIACEVVSFHQKGSQAMSLTPFWRVTITLNDEPENLMVLPPLDESLKDKITLLQASHATMPFEAEDLEARKQFRERLTAELPAFLHWLLTWKIPASMADTRYGIKAFQDGNLLRELEYLQPEFRLLELIDTLDVWQGQGPIWRGSALELRRLLEDLDKRHEVEKVLTFNTAAGVYLGRLAKHLPKRVKKTKDQTNKHLWEIHRQ